MNDDTIARVLSGRATESESTQLLAWRRLSDRNERRFQAVASLLELVAGADEERKTGQRPTAGQIIAAAEETRGATPGTNATPIRPGWRGVAVGIAAAILLTLGVTSVRFDAAPPPDLRVQQFVTGPSEQATVVLTDGTVVRLGEDSRLQVPAGASGREVSFVGRGYFAVAHDPSNPFKIHTASGEVRVLGTRFSLDTSEEDLRLVVVEGRVSLAGEKAGDELELEARQMVRVVRGTRLPVTEVPDPTILADWVGNFLAFQNTPLQSAAEEIEREYEVDIELSNADLANRTITAWFAGWSLEDVIEVVCIVADAQCEIDDNHVSIRPSRPFSP